MRLLAVTILTGLMVTGCASTQSTVAGGSNSTGGSATATPSSSLSAPGSSGSASGGAGSSSSGSSGSAAASQCPDQPNEGQYNSKLAKPVPSSVEVAWVLRCSVVPAAGGHHALLVERSNSDPAALLNALRAPDEPRSSGACPLLRMVVPYFALIQRDGTALEPKLPVTGCLLPQAAVIQSLNKLQFVVIEKKPLS
jgi:hypothetical protein